MTEIKRKRGRPHQIEGITIKNDYPAFTIRLPLALYARLSAEAEKEKRSRAAHVEKIIENWYKD